MDNDAVAPAGQPRTLDPPDRRIVIPAVAGEDTRTGDAVELVIDAATGKGFVRRRRTPGDELSIDPWRSNLVTHARRELAAGGMLGSDPVYANAVLSAVAAMVPAADDSGAAYLCAIDWLMTLLSYGTLSALTDDPDEWFEVMPGLHQSRRRPDAFSTDGGRTYTMNDGPREPDGSKVVFVSQPSGRAG